MRNEARPTRRPLQVLLVEDNQADARLTREILLQGDVSMTVTLARDGEEAAELLWSIGRRPRPRPPDLVLLDLNLPRKDGRELLAEMKADPALRSIPVIVLTTSSAAEDIAQAYDLRANGYVVKPHGLDAFTSAIRATERFWLALAELP